MATHEIPKPEWESYFAAFTERHQGALVSIEDVDPAAAQPEYETRDLPFLSIRCAQQGEHNPDTIVVVTASATGDSFESHTIHAPKEVYHKPGAGVLSNEVNADEVLEITSGGRPPIYYLTFRHP
jgi:hypothetical protein